MVRGKDRCPSCGWGVLRSHCDSSAARCEWVVCTRCRSYGSLVANRWHSSADDPKREPGRAPLKGVEDRPRAAADAYTVMCDVMPKWYFEQGPPVTGVCLTVAGRDYVKTQWEMHAGIADQVIDLLRRDHRVTDVRRRLYDRREAA